MNRIRYTPRHAGETGFAARMSQLERDRIDYQRAIDVCTRVGTFEATFAAVGLSVERSRRLTASMVRTDAA